MKVGVNPLATGIMARQGNDLYFFSPTEFASAELRLLDPSEAKKTLNRLIEEGESKELNKWVKEGGSWSSLEGLIKEMHEGSLNLLKEGVMEERASVADVDYMTIRRRGSGRRERHRRIYLKSPETRGGRFQEGFDYLCQCPAFGYGSAKARLRLGHVDEGKKDTIHFCCHHVATGLIYLAKSGRDIELPFSFSDRQIFETLIRKLKGRRRSRNDSLLLKEGVTTQFAEQMIRNGYATAETVKERVVIDESLETLFGRIAAGMKARGYEHQGFATEFPSRRKATTSIVYSGGSHDIRIIYDERFGGVPLFLEKDFGLEGEPSSRMVEINQGFVEVDNRTRRECASTLRLPPFAVSKELERRYETFLRDFRHFSP